MRRWLAPALSVLLLAACGPGDAKASKAPVTRAPDGLVLDAQIVAQDGVVTVSYTLRNDRSAAVVVADGVPVRDGAADPKADPAAVYITPRSDGVVELSRRTFLQPEGVGVATALLMRGSRVEPAATATGNVRVPLPLQARHPYQAAGYRVEVPGRPRAVVFCLGVIALDDLSPEQRQSPRPVLEHATYQAVLCSPEQPLKG